MQRFLVRTEARQARPAGLRYNPAIGLTLAPDGSVFVKYATPGDSATETRRHGCERDRATSVHGEVGKLLRDNPEEEAVRYLVCGDVAMRRGAAAERPLSSSQL